MAKKTQNETTALKKWPILRKIVGKMSIKKHKRNHRAQEMADFMENYRKNDHQKNTNETTALKKWRILWKIVGKMTIKKHKRNHRTQEMADFMENCR